MFFLPSSHQISSFRGALSSFQDHSSHPAWWLLFFFFDFDVRISLCLPFYFQMVWWHYCYRECKLSELESNTSSLFPVSLCFLFNLENQLSEFPARGVEGFQQGQFYLVNLLWQNFSATTDRQLQIIRSIIWWHHNYNFEWHNCCQEKIEKLCPSIVL